MTPSAIVCLCRLVKEGYFDTLPADDLSYPFDAHVSAMTRMTPDEFYDIYDAFMRTRQADRKTRVGS